MSKFQIVQIADVHLHQNNRLEDKIIALEAVSDYINNNNVSMFVDLGDTFENPNPTEEVRIVYANFLKNISLECKIIKLGGNHETRDNEIYAYESSILYNLWSKENMPPIIYVKTIYQIEKWGYNLIFCNYGHEDKISSLKLKNSNVDGDVNILFAHLTVNGSQINENYVLRNDGVDDVFFKDFNHVFLGDIHKRQIKDNWRYIGALTKNNFGESVNKDGFSVITIDDESNVTEEFIEIPGKEYIKLEMTEESGLLYPDGLKGNIVKIIISGSSEWITTINRPSLIKAVEKHEPYSLLFEWNITDTKKREAIEHNQSEQSQLKEYIDANITDVELAKDGEDYLKQSLVNEGETV